MAKNKLTAKFCENAPVGNHPNHPMSEAAVCQALERMGFDMVGHGIRGVVSTGLNELGFPPHLVEMQLGHKLPNKVEAPYNKAAYFDKRREMMQKWADHLDELLNNERSKNRK